MFWLPAGIAHLLLPCEGFRFVEGQTLLKRFKCSQPRIGLACGALEEALLRAVERDVNGVATRVFTAEHLAAICLEVGRPKDHDRIIRFVEAGALDAAAFEDILQRHCLLEKWTGFQQNFLEP